MLENEYQIYLKQIPEEITSDEMLEEGYRKVWWFWDNHKDKFGLELAEKWRKICEKYADF